MTRPPRFALTILLAIGLGVGCGGGGSSKASSSSSPTASSSSASRSASTGSSPASSAASSSADDRDACSLLTDDEVAAVIGAPVTRNEPATTPGALGCVKGNDRADDLSKAAFVSYSQFTTGGDALLDQFGSEEGSEEVTGIGDRAVFQASGGILFFSANGKTAEVQVFKLGQPGTRDEVVAMAKALLPRLP
jgi:hypothetical protein